MLTDAQRAAYDRDGFIVVPDVFSPAEIAELRRVTDEFVARSATVAANDDVYDLEDTHSPPSRGCAGSRRRICIHPAYFRASRNAKVVAVLKDLWGTRPLRHRQAQHEVGRLRRAGRVAPGLGLLPAHQRRPRRGRHHDRRCRRWRTAR